jgi:N-acetylmuramate 1-kinase
VTWELSLPDETATAALAATLAGILGSGDRVGLSGDLGSGKTSFARALIRSLAGDPRLEVPSPTFTLMQLYETPRGPVTHADLYRLAGPEELHELGVEEAAEAGILLVEWPERGGPGLAQAPCEVELALDPAAPQGRRARVIGRGGFAPRLSRLKAVTDLLARAGWLGARRVPIQGDASTRAYERLIQPDGRTAVLMISPPRADGPPVRRGRPYSAIAKLAESVHAFVALDRGLRALGLSAPAILAEDLEAGLLLLEDLGGEPVVNAEGPIAERYGEAVRLLARLHGAPLPAALPVTEGLDHVLPPYDLEALLIEVELLADWYAPHIAGTNLSGSARAELLSVWSEVLLEIVEASPTWTLRDFHSPNLLWLPQRDGIARVGLLDFQDAVLGHPAYDAASLLQDARVDASAELELRLLGLYARERAAEPGFDMAAFARAYAILGAQRATKILGIFARLDRRDGKPQYLRHLPRIEGYLKRNFAHPALDRVKAWYARHLPHLAENP